MRTPIDHKTSWIFIEITSRSYSAASYFVKIIWCSCWFCNPPPYFEAAYCFFCGHRRVVVARYRMICFVLIASNQNLLYLPRVIYSYRYAVINNKYPNIQSNLRFQMTQVYWGECIEWVKRQPKSWIEYRTPLAHGFCHHWIMDHILSRSLYLENKCFMKC